MNRPRSCATRLVGLFAVLAVLFVALPAQASSETMRRAISNIVWAPFDLALSPISVATGLISNLQDVDDSPGVRAFYPLPAFAFALGVNVGASVIRLVTGLLEFGPAIPLLFFETDLDPLFNPIQDAAALVEYENDVFPVRFGINYTVSDY